MDGAVLSAWCHVQLESLSARVPDVLLATKVGGWVGFDTFDGEMASSFAVQKYGTLLMILATPVMVSERLPLSGSATARAGTAST